jgi:hypothetical protein
MCSALFLGLLPPSQGQKKSLSHFYFLTLAGAIDFFGLGSSALDGLV